MKLRFQKHQRLRTTPEFQACYKGVRSGDDHLLVFATRNETTYPRIGVSVSKKHGNAVARNRKKRLLREAWRHHQREVSDAVDFVLVPRQRSDSTLSDYQNSLKHLTRKVCQKLNRDGKGR